MFQIFMFESVLKILEHFEICNACWKHIEKVLKTIKKKHVEIFSMFWKL